MRRGFLAMSSAFRQPVFLISVFLIACLLIAGAAFPAAFEIGANAALAWVTRTFGWFYLLSVFGFVAVLVYLGFSKYGETRLGPPDSTPEFSYYSWVAMLLAAGFGIGLVFYGVAEPMSHFARPAEPSVTRETAEAARRAIQYSFFNWGLSQWAAFSIVGLIIGFYQFRRGQPGLVSVVMRPLTGETDAKPGKIGGALDVFATVATVMGVATSLGLGVLQINGGMAFLFGLPEGFTWQAIILVFVAVAYMISASTGLDKGIRILSSINLGLAMALMVFVLVFGPTIAILRTLVQGLGDYLQYFFEMSLNADAYDNPEWVGSWTIFYWAWVISWSPFVGTFVARISRGRTIREYVIGVLVMPPLIAAVWIGIFGGAALTLELQQEPGLALAVQQNITTALFKLLELLPMPMVTSVFAMLLILVFLVTSADSASYIVAQLTDQGSINPPLAKRLVWGGLIAAICLTLIATGGLQGLQAGVIIAALPFTVILYLMVWALFRELAADRATALAALYEAHDQTPVGATIEEARRLDEEGERPADDNDVAD